MTAYRCINCGLSNGHFRECASARAERIRGHIAIVPSVADNLRRLQAEMLASDDPDERAAARELDGIADRLNETFADIAQAVSDYENGIEA